MLPQSPGQARVAGKPYYPMQGYRWLSGLPNPARNNGQDIDRTPIQFRHYVNASGVQDVQISNGLRNGIARGVRAIPGLVAKAYLMSSVPRIPGQQRGDVSGFHARGPSPLNVQQWLETGPGSQPDNPGGPGKIAGNTLFNPMTG